MLLEREACEGHDSCLRGTPFPIHGSVQGEVYAAPFVGMRRNAGDVAVVPSGPGW